MEVPTCEVDGRVVPSPLDTFKGLVTSARLDLCPKTAVGHDKLETAAICRLLRRVLRRTSVC